MRKRWIEGRIRRLEKSLVEFAAHPRNDVLPWPHMVYIRIYTQKNFELLRARIYRRPECFWGPLHKVANIPTPFIYRIFLCTFYISEEERKVTLALYSYFSHLLFTLVACTSLCVRVHQWLYRRWSLNNFSLLVKKLLLFFFGSKFIIYCWDIFSLASGELLSSFPWVTWRRWFI